MVDRSMGPVGGLALQDIGSFGLIYHVKGGVEETTRFGQMAVGPCEWSGSGLQG